MSKKSKIKKFLPYIILHIILLIYSFCTVFAKIASGQDFLSLGFFMFYGLELAILVIYALLWQQVLKSIPLTVAFCNKAITIIWGMVWGALIFNETINPFMVIGAIIVLVGIILVVTSHE